MKKIIIANWKCNPDNFKKAKKLFNAVKKDIKGVKNEVVICPPFVYLTNFQFPISNFHLGAQNCHWENNGPYTGEVSPRMLKDLGCEYVIIGHSERRIHFRETNEMINKKLKAALQAGLILILCIGEKRGESPQRVIANQLRKDLKGITKKDLKKIIIAYEPVWAISTSGGEICSPNYAEKILKFIKQRFNGKIIYGGSVNSRIAKSYTDAGFDGLLVGGASLDANEFIKIVKYV